MGSNRCFISIIIKLIINLILLILLFSFSLWLCFKIENDFRCTIWWTWRRLVWFKQSHKKHWHEKTLLWPFWLFLLLFVFSRRSVFNTYLLTYMNTSKYINIYLFEVNFLLIQIQNLYLYRVSNHFFTLFYLFSSLIEIE